jgi:hypothetical protein
LSQWLPLLKQEFNGGIPEKACSPSLWSIYSRKVNRENDYLLYRTLRLNYLGADHNNAGYYRQKNCINEGGPEVDNKKG